MSGGLDLGSRARVKCFGVRALHMFLAQAVFGLLDFGTGDFP